MWAVPSLFGSYWQVLLSLALIGAGIALPRALCSGRPRWRGELRRAHGRRRASLLLLFAARALCVKLRHF